MAITKQVLAGLLEKNRNDNQALVDVAHLPRRAAKAPLDLATLGEAYRQINVAFDASTGALTCAMQHHGRPCFTPDLIAEVRDLQITLAQGLADTADCPLRYLVSTSDHADFWCLGGDLDLFTRLIRAQDEDGLRDYAHSCIDILYPYAVNLNLPIVTIALVKGDALGGGFEAVLAHDVVIAERGARFGLPEVLFNLFPGMGAYSLLARKLGGAKARQMILSGKVYSAEELFELGLVDVLAEVGEGDAALAKYLKRNQRRHATEVALALSAQRCDPIEYEELIDVTDLWVEAALGLDEGDLKRMQRLVRAQSHHVEPLRQSA